MMVDGIEGRYNHTELNSTNSPHGMGASQTEGAVKVQYTVSGRSIETCCKYVYIMLGYLYYTNI